MPAVINLDGSATAFDLSVSPFTGWQHGRIDASAIAHVASFARRSCHLRGWVDVSPFRDATRTTFAVAHEVRVNPSYESRFIQVTDKCYAVCTVAHVGNSSCSFLTKVFLQPKHVYEALEDDGATPLLKGSGNEHPSAAQLQERDYHEWMVLAGQQCEKFSTCNNPQQQQEKENDANGAVPSSVTRRRRHRSSPHPIELGMTTLTMVYISTITRKSMPLKEELRVLLIEGSQNKSLYEEWKRRGNNDRLKIDFDLMRRGGDKLFSTLAREALMFSASVIGGVGQGGGGFIPIAGPAVVTPAATDVSPGDAFFSPITDAGAAAAAGFAGDEATTPLYHSPPHQHAYVSIPISAGTASKSTHGDLLQQLASKAEVLTAFNNTTHSAPTNAEGVANQTDSTDRAVSAPAVMSLPEQEQHQQQTVAPPHPLPGFASPARSSVGPLVREGLITSLHPGRAAAAPPLSSNCSGGASHASLVSSSPSPIYCGGGGAGIHAARNAAANTVAFSPVIRRHMAIFTSRRALRPADFDFNLHMNMNMYVSAVLDALKYAMRDFLDLQRKQQAIAKAKEKMALLKKGCGGHGGSLAEELAAAAASAGSGAPHERGTPIVPLDYQFPVVAISEENLSNLAVGLPASPSPLTSPPGLVRSGGAAAADADAAAAALQQQHHALVSVHHLGEVLGRLGYQSVVSKFTNKSHVEVRGGAAAAATTTTTPHDPVHKNTSTAIVGDYMSRQTTEHHAEEEEDGPSSTGNPVTDFINNVGDNGPAAVSVMSIKRDANDMTRFASVEECVLSSRIEYLKEVTELTSELEVTVMIPLPPTMDDGADAAAAAAPSPPSAASSVYDGTSGGYFTVDPETLRVSQSGGGRPIPIHYSVRCVPPSWVEDPTPYLASSGELVLRPVSDLAVVMPTFGGVTLEKEAQMAKEGRR